LLFFVHITFWLVVHFPIVRRKASARWAAVADIEGTSSWSRFWVHSSQRLSVRRNASARCAAD
jgi:hypothetical protein